MFLKPKTDFLKYRKYDLRICAPLLLKQYEYEWRSFVSHLIPLYFVIFRCILVCFVESQCIFVLIGKRTVPNFCHCEEPIGDVAISAV